MKSEKAVLLRGVNLFQKLSRLVAYKIQQLKLLTRPGISFDQWGKIEACFQRENHYAGRAGFEPPGSEYEKAMWSYYELLETISLNRLNEMKNEVFAQIRTLELKKRLDLL